MHELEETYLVEARGCPGGYGVRATDAAAVLKACPALTALSIEIHHLGGYRTSEMFEDVEVYGDVFWESVARHCPNLERISVSSCDHDDYHTIMVKTLTDRTLTHLAELPYLLECDLPPGRVTGRGVFEYIRLVSKTEDAIGKKRSILISMGGVKRKPVEVPVFYFEILELLKLLAETDEEALGAAFCHPKPNVVVYHPHEFGPDRAWLDTYAQNELTPLLKTVQEKHPSLKLGMDRGRSHINKIQLLWFYE